MEIYDKNFKKIKNIKVGGENEEFEDYSEDDDNVNGLQIASKYGGGNYVNEMFGGEEDEYESDEEEDDEDSSDEDEDEEDEEDEDESGESDESDESDKVGAYGGKKEEDSSDEDEDEEEEEDEDEDEDWEEDEEEDPKKEMGGQYSGLVNLDENKNNYETVIRGGDADNKTDVKIIMLN